MEFLRDRWSDIEQLSNPLTALIGIALVLVTALIVRRVLARILRRTYWRRVDRAAASQGIADITRIKRQKTLGTLLESLLRYLVYGAALIVILSIITPGAASAIFGASLLVVLVGFGFQRLLADVVAGALLIFEGHFAVGDVISVHPTDVTGVVEEFSLRTTTLRTLGGDRVTITNGNLLNFTRWGYGQRELRIELLARGTDVADRVEGACRAAAAVPGALFVRPPALVSATSIDEQLTHIVVTVVVAPGLEPLVDQFAAQLEAQLADDLVGTSVVLGLLQSAYDDYRAGVLVRE